MSIGLLVALTCGVLVAYLNGANDVSKSISTLAGSGVTDYRRAILWGTVCTGVGGLASTALSQAMIGTFGARLLVNQSAPTLTGTLAILLGVAACVGVATWLSLPVSTTHAIIGAVIGVCSFSYGVEGVNWGVLGGKIVLPLLLSPFLALGLTVAALRTWHLMTVHFKEAPECLCLDLEAASIPSSLVVTGSALALLPTAETHLSVGSQDVCATERSFAFRVTASRLHWLTSGATSFARGLNDAPKIVALVLFSTTLSTGTPAIRPLAFALVTLSMIVGSWTAGKRVTALLAEKVTPMNHQEGFMANLVTAVLVGPGAALGLPMSTTHVSSGAIIGLGVEKWGGLNWKTVRHMFLAWIVTVPLAAALGVAAYTCLSAL